MNSSSPIRTACCATWSRFRALTWPYADAGIVTPETHGRARSVSDKYFARGPEADRETLGRDGKAIRRDFDRALARLDEDRPSQPEG